MARAMCMCWGPFLPLLVRGNHVAEGGYSITVKYSPDGNRMGGCSLPPHQLGELHLPFRNGRGSGGNVYLTGSDFYDDYVTIKHDTFGGPLWMAEYSEPPHGSNCATDIAVDENGCVYVTGSSEGEGSGSDYATVKYDPEGNELWVARYDGWEGNDDRAERSL